jgi:hypothetical protein
MTASLTPTASLSEDDYQAIEAAVMETARGRWFLLEYARRSRASELLQVVDAISRLEHSLRDAQGQWPQAPAQVPGGAPNGLQGRLLGERTREIAERLQNLAWDLRERDFDDMSCDAIEAQARAVLALAKLGSEGTPTALHREGAVPLSVAAPVPAVEFAPIPSTVRDPVPSEAQAIAEAAHSSEILSSLELLPLSEQLKIFS